MEEIADFSWRPRLDRQRPSSQKHGRAGSASDPEWAPSVLPPRQLGWEPVGIQHRAIVEHQGPLHRVPELADVPRPRVIEQNLPSGRRDFGSRSAQGLTELAEEVTSQREYVFRPVSKRRDVDLDNVQSAKKICAELPGAHRRLE